MPDSVRVHYQCWKIVLFPYYLRYGKTDDNVQQINHKKPLFCWDDVAKADLNLWLKAAYCDWMLSKPLVSLPEFLKCDVMVS